MKRFIALFMTVLMVIGSVLPAFATDAAVENTTLAALGTTLPEQFADTTPIRFIDFVDANSNLTLDDDYRIYAETHAYGPSIGVFNGAKFAATFTVETAGDYEFVFENHVRGESWKGGGNVHWGTVQINDGTVYTITDQAVVDAGYAQADGSNFFQGPTVTLEPGVHTIYISGTVSNGANTYFKNAYVAYAGRSDVTAENPFADYFSTTEIALYPAGAGLNDGAGGNTWNNFGVNDSGADQGGIRPEKTYAYKFNVTVPYDGVYDLAAYVDNSLKNGVVQLTLNGEVYNIYSSADVTGSAYYAVAEDVALDAGTYVATISRVNGGDVPLTKTLLLGVADKAEITSVTTTNPYTDGSAYYEYNEVSFFDQKEANGNVGKDDNGTNFNTWYVGDYKPSIGKGGIWIRKTGYAFTLKFTPEESGSYELALYLANMTSSNTAYLGNTTTMSLTLSDANGTIGTYSVKEYPVEENSTLYYQFAKDVRFEAGVEYTLTLSQNGTTSSTIVDLVYAATALDDVTKEIPEDFTAAADAVQFFDFYNANGGSTNVFPWNSGDFVYDGISGALGQNAIIPRNTTYVYNITFTPDAADKYSFVLYLADRVTEKGKNNGLYPLTQGAFEITLSNADGEIGTYVINEVAPYRTSKLYYRFAEDVSLEAGVEYTLGVRMAAASSSALVTFFYAPTVCDVHTPGDAATCTEDQVCTVCGEVLAPATGHLYAAGTRSNVDHPHEIFNVCACGLEEPTGTYDVVEGCEGCRSDVSTESPFTDYYKTVEYVVLNAGAGLNESAGSNTWYQHGASEAGCTVGGVRPMANYAYKFAVKVDYDGTYDIAVQLDHVFKGTAVITLNGATYTVESTSKDGAYYYVLAEDVFLEAGTYIATAARLNGGEIPLVKALYLAAAAREDIPGVTDTNPFTDPTVYYGYKEVNAQAQAASNGNSYQTTVETEDENGTPTTVTTTNFSSWYVGDYNPSIGKAGIWLSNRDYTYTMTFTPEKSGSYELALYLANMTSTNTAYTLPTTSYTLTLSDANGEIGTYSFAELPVEANSTRYYPFAEDVRFEAGVEYTLEINVAAKGSSTIVDLVYAATELDDVTMEIPENLTDPVTVAIADYVNPDYTDAEGNVLNPMSYLNGETTSYYYYLWYNNSYAGTLPGKTGVLLNVNDHKVYVPFTVSADSASGYTFVLFAANGYSKTEAFAFAAEVTNAAGEVVYSGQIEEVPGLIGSKLYYRFADGVELPAGDYTIAFSKLGTTGTTIVDFIYAATPCYHVNVDPATCDKAQTCLDCGAELSPALGHSYTAGAYTDPNHPHAIYDVCAVCNAMQPTGETGYVLACADCQAPLPEGDVLYGTPEAIEGETGIDAVWDEAWEAAKAAGTLTVVYDGDPDKNTFKETTGWDDATATVYAMYDENYVYFYAVVTDNDVVRRHDDYYATGNSYGVDGIEFRLNFGGAANAANQFKITVDAHGVKAFNIWADRYPHTSLDTSLYETVITDTGYVIELAVPHTIEGYEQTNLLDASELGFNMWLVDAQPSAEGTNTPTEASKGVDYLVYGLNYVDPYGDEKGVGNGVAAYYYLGEMEEEHVCDYTYDSRVDADHPHAVYGICECGEEQLTAESSKDADCAKCTFKFAGATMELSDALTMKFAFAKSLLTGIVDENYKVVIKYYDNDGELVVKEVPYKDWIPYGANNYLATIDLAAKQMGDRMDVRMYDGNGYQIGDTYYDSIREYIGRQLEKNWFKDPAAPNTKGVTLAVAMLDYGAAAQTHFEYKTDDLANSIITPAMRAVVNELDLSVTNYQVKGNNFYGTSVAVENRIDIRMFFKNVKDDMYAIATYVDRDGVSQAVRYNSDVFVAYGANYKGIRLDMLKAADYGYVVTVTMYNADGTVHGTAADSVESYAARVFATNNEDLKTVVQALTKYCKASYAYFVG